LFFYSYVSDQCAEHGTYKTKNVDRCLVYEDGASSLVHADGDSSLVHEDGDSSLVHEDGDSSLVHEDGDSKFPPKSSGRPTKNTASHTTRQLVRTSSITVSKSITK
jgi:hypothetical protein